MADSLPLVEEVVAERLPASQVFLIGNGPNVATALEGGLKLQESAQVPAHAWQLEEAMHGPWSIINPGDWVILWPCGGRALRRRRDWRRRCSTSASTSGSSPTSRMRSPVRGA